MSSILPSCNISLLKKPKTWKGTGQMGTDRYSWNKGLMKIFVLGIFVIALIGCGKSETVTIGEPGEKGILQKDIDKSKDTAAAATEKVKEGNKEAFGD